MKAILVYPGHELWYLALCWTPLILASSPIGDSFMVNVFNIIVTSAMLVLGNDVNNPVPYCTVQMPVQQPRPEYDPEGGCKELGARILAAVQEQYPDAAVRATTKFKRYQRL